MGSGIGKNGKINLKDAVKKSSGALEKIERIEIDLAQMGEALQKTFGQISQQLASSENVLNAVGEILGIDVVKAKMAEREVRKVQAQADADKEALDKAVAEGNVGAVTEIGENTLIVGTETDAEGKIMTPGRVQISFSQLQPAIKELLTGKGPGTIIDTPIGGKFEVKEVYGVVAKPVDAGNTVAAESTQQELPQV